MASPRFVNEIPDFRFSISLDVLDPVHWLAPVTRAQQKRSQPRAWRTATVRGAVVSDG